MQDSHSGGGIPAIIGAVIAFFSSFSTEDFAHLAGGFAGCCGAAYTIWRWRREAREEARAAAKNSNRGRDA